MPVPASWTVEDIGAAFVVKGTRQKPAMTFLFLEGVPFPTAVGARTLSPNAFRSAINARQPVQCSAASFSNRKRVDLQPSVRSPVPSTPVHLSQ
jgi:hypothetical protein